MPIFGELLSLPGSDSETARRTATLPLHGTRRSFRRIPRDRASTISHNRKYRPTNLEKLLATIRAALPLGPCPISVGGKLCGVGCQGRAITTFSASRPGRRKVAAEAGGDRVFVVGQFHALDSRQVEPHRLPRDGRAADQL